MLLIIVHRLLQSLVLPPLNALLFIILGLVLLYKFRKFASFLIGFGIMFLYIQATPFFAYTLARAIEMPPATEEQIKNSQAIIVLGGGIKNTGYEYPINAVTETGTLVRLRYTAYLAHQYPNKLIITSGGYTSVRFSEAGIMRDTLITSFNVHNPILIENHSRNTDENAKYVAQMLRQLNLANIIVVTQAYHTRRAVGLFKKYGVNAIAAPTDYYDNTDANTPQLAFVPNASSMQETSKILHEVFGYLFSVTFNNF